MIFIQELKYPQKKDKGLLINLDSVFRLYVKVNMI